MCGIIGLLLADENAHVNQLLFDGLTVLQHRGQDAAGMVTSERGRRLHLRKDNGLVRDVFQTHHMTELRGHLGIGHCRYPTAGTSSCAEAQPLYTNYPHGICVAHNGNLTNTRELSHYVQTKVGRHINTDSDSELLLNLFAEYLMEQEKQQKQQQTASESSHKNTNGNGSTTTATATATTEQAANAIFAALTKLMNHCKGGYAGLYLINGVGLVGIRDPHGIRPLVFGCRRSGKVDKMDECGIPQSPAAMDAVEQTLDYVCCSESVAIDTLGFQLVRDVKAGEAIFIDMQGNCHTKVLCPQPQKAPCIFEYVYFARPDSIMDGISVYESRLKMGEKLAEKILRLYPKHDIDVVIPIPDTSRTAALQAAYRLERPFREGFIKNRYIARTFIMPGQATRKKSVRLKLNTIKSEFHGRNVLLVDDSIVRGTTAHEIVQMARDAGARRVFFCSAAPPIRYPNVYGIDIPTRKELIAHERNEAQIAAKIGCDWVVYQDLKDLQASVREAAPTGVPLLPNFDTSCFSGQYVTGEQIGDSYFARLCEERNDGAKERRKRGIEHVSDAAAAAGPADGGGDSGSHKNPKPAASNDGCEPMSNDKRSGGDVANGGGNGNGSSPCEPLTNQKLGVVN